MVLHQADGRREPLFGRIVRVGRALRLTERNHFDRHALAPCSSSDLTGFGVGHDGVDVITPPSVNGRRRLRLREYAERPTRSGDAEWTIAMRIPAAIAFLVLSGSASCALAADSVQPVVVTSVGPKAMRLRVAAGVVGPCTSPSNTPLFDGTIGPGQQIVLGTSENCVCVEHTFGDFPDANWSESQIACHVMSCIGRRCRPNPDPAIQISVSSDAR